tara:strand:- start:4211 stop:5638 length:1428 start_codon:yes stop_codon:yes gene_type:complete
MELKSTNKLEYLLTELDVQGIDYVSWKNNHQLQSVMVGNGDIDLFVSFNNRSQFFNLCRLHDWIEVINPISDYPLITHFYRLGDNLEVFHIHVYFKLITGETWIKEYSIPFDDWLIENRVWNNEHNIWVLNKSCQSYLFLIRHLLKCGSITSRFLYKRELSSYNMEWNECSNGVEQDDIKGPIDIKSFLDGSRAFGKKLELPLIKSAFLFRLSFIPFLRHKLSFLALLRLQSFILRLINKVFLKRKKVLPESGLTIAISGVDGSGKTTMLQEVDKILGQFLTIERFHIGRPQGKLIEFIWKILGNKSENSSMPGCSDITSPSSRGRAVNGAILAFLRFRKARIILKRASLGSLMLIDRWPTNELGKMDGPRIIIGENSGWIERLCKHFESWAYAKMPHVDICYFFEVPIEVAIERNHLRIKENKETEKQISARFLGNFDYKPLAKKTIRFENSGEFEAERKDLLKNIWHEISSRY